MTIHEALKICFDEDIRVYPVISGKNHQIEYSEKGVVKVKYTKILKSTKTVNEAITKTYIFLANELQQKKIPPK